MCFIMPSLVKLCCRILKLATNQQSNFARQFTFPKGILPGQSTSMSWQQAAPEPSCSILARLVLRRSLSQPSSSPRDISMALLELMVTSFIISPVMLIRILTTTIIPNLPTQHPINRQPIRFSIIRKAIVSQTIRSFLAGIDLLGVELEFLSLQDVSVSSAGLSGSGADASEESLLGELISNLGIDDSGLLALVDAGLGALGLLVLHLDILCLLDVEVNTVVIDVPLGEGSGVDLDDAVLDEGVGTDQLVVGGVVDHVEDTGLAGGGLGGPVEVALLETQGTELIVSSSDSHAADSGLVGDQLGVGDGTGLLEGSLLLVDGHPATGQSALMP